MLLKKLKTVFVDIMVACYFDSLYKIMLYYVSVRDNYICWMKLNINMTDKNRREFYNFINNFVGYVRSADCLLTYRLNFFCLCGNIFDNYIICEAPDGHNLIIHIVIRHKPIV